MKEPTLFSYKDCDNFFTCEKIQKFKYSTGRKILLQSWRYQISNHHFVAALSIKEFSEVKPQTALSHSTDHKRELLIFSDLQNSKHTPSLFLQSQSTWTTGMPPDFKEVQVLETFTGLQKNQVIQDILEKLQLLKETALEVSVFHQQISPFFIE